MYGNKYKNQLSTHLGGCEFGEGRGCSRRREGPGVDGVVDGDIVDEEEVKLAAVTTFSRDDGADEALGHILLSFSKSPTLTTPPRITWHCRG